MNDSDKKEDQTWQKLPQTFVKGQNYNKYMITKIESSTIITPNMARLMETRGRWLRLVVLVAAVSTWWRQANSQPQINLLNKGCSQYNATNIPDFFNNLNATFSDLRTQLSGGGGRRFATAQQARSSDPVYAMVQCRNYMSEADCVACYAAAVAQIRNCSAANGARVIYDGCFLRYFHFPKLTLIQLFFLLLISILNLAGN